jgi:hypothetical protein
MTTPPSLTRVIPPSPSGVSWLVMCVEDFETLVLWKLVLLVMIGNREDELLGEGVREKNK